MPTKIFIGNLTSDTTPDDIRPLFEKHGKVTECAVLKNYGFVHMESESDAKAAISKLDGTFVRSQKMRVEMSTGRKGYGPSNIQVVTMPTKIFIGNLTYDTTPDDIRPLFEKHGKVTECAVLKSYGFVHMESESDAKAATSKLDGTFVRSQKMRVEMSTGRKGYGPGSLKDKRGFAFGEGSHSHARLLPPPCSRGSGRGRSHPAFYPPHYELYPAPRQRPPPLHHALPPAYHYAPYAADYWECYKADDYNAYGAVHDGYMEEEEEVDTAYYRGPVQRRRGALRGPRPPHTAGRGRYPPRYDTAPYSAPYEPPRPRGFARPSGLKRSYNSYVEDISLDEVSPKQMRGKVRGRGARGRGQGRPSTTVSEEAGKEETKPKVTDPMIKFQKFHQELPMLKKQSEVVKAVDLAARQADIEVVQVYIQVEPGKPKSLIRVDVFFDDHFIASGVGFDKATGLLAAYKNILVSSEWQDLPSLVTVSRRLVLEDRKQAGFQHIVYRTISHDTNNLNFLKNLRLYPVDFNIKLEEVVLMVDSLQDWDAADQDQAKYSRYIQNSLSANGLYISWQVSRGKDLDYSCKMFVQKKLLATASGRSVQAAKHKAATSCFKFLAKTQDILTYIPKMQYASPEIEVEEMVKRAVEKHNAFYQIDDKDLDMTTPDGQKWMKKVLDEILDEFCSKIGLESLNIKSKSDFAFQEKLMDGSWSRGLTVGTRTRSGIKYLTINRRPKRSPQEIAIILRLCGGKSGHYELVVSNKTFTPEQLEQAKQQYFANKTVTV